jgi:hypothetical protein
MEGAAVPAAIRQRLARFRWQGIGFAHTDRVAARQSRASKRLGENDAWQVAIAESMDAAGVPRASQAR